MFCKHEIFVKWNLQNCEKQSPSCNILFSLHNYVRYTSLLVMMISMAGRLDPHFSEKFRFGKTINSIWKIISYRKNFDFCFQVYMLHCCSLSFFDSENFWGSEKTDLDFFGTTLFSWYWAGPNYIQTGLKLSSIFYYEFFRCYIFFIIATF